MSSTERTSCLWRHRGLQLLAALGTALLIAGCVRILEPRQANLTYYLLDGRPGIESTGTDSTGLNVGLREPTLASYLDAARIVTRYGANTIQFSDFHRWGEDLDRAVNRVVARALEAQKGIYSTQVVPWSHGSSFDYVVEMHVLQFEGRSPQPPPTEDESDAVVTGHSQMRVQWTILGPDGETLRARGTTEHRVDGWPVNDYGALVSRLDTSLVVLSDDIGTRLQLLQRNDRQRPRVRGRQ